MRTNKNIIRLTENDLYRIVQTILNSPKYKVLTESNTDELYINLDDIYRMAPSRKLSDIIGVLLDICNSSDKKVHIDVMMVVYGNEPEAYNNMYKTRYMIYKENGSLNATPDLEYVTESVIIHCDLSDIRSLAKLKYVGGSINLRGEARKYLDNFKLIHRGNDFNVYEFIIDGETTNVIRVKGGVNNYD